MKIIFVLLTLTFTVLAHHDQNKENIHLNDIRLVTLNEKIVENPTAVLYTLRSQVYLELGLKDKARHDFEHALSLDKDFQQAKEQLSKIK